MVGWVRVGAPFGRSADKVHLSEFNDNPANDTYLVYTSLYSNNSTSILGIQWANQEESTSNANDSGFRPQPIPSPLASSWSPPRYEKHHLAYHVRDWSGFSGPIAAEEVDELESSGEKRLRKMEIKPRLSLHFLRTINQLCITR